jgi:D-galacturonate reductase
MSQPKIQLTTFKAWAGISSDISYYLNSHHIDFHGAYAAARAPTPRSRNATPPPAVVRTRPLTTAVRRPLSRPLPPLLAEWVANGASRPVRVFAMGATGVAARELGRPCEDTITVNAVWQNLAADGSGDGSTAIASYTSSWIAPPGDVHSQQRFFAMTQAGEVTVDQAHRGYSTAVDGKGYASPNPLFMKYTPDEGRFVGQTGYGYRSLEAFVDAVAAINAGRASARDFDASLPTVHTTYLTTAVLEAGRRSLDAGGAVVEIVYDDAASGGGKDRHAACKPVGLRLAAAPSASGSA